MKLNIFNFKMKLCCHKFDNIINELKKATLLMSWRKPAGYVFAFRKVHSNASKNSTWFKYCLSLATFCLQLPMWRTSAVSLGVACRLVWHFLSFSQTWCSRPNNTSSPTTEIKSWKDSNSKLNSNSLLAIKHYKTWKTLIETATFTETHTILLQKLKYVVIFIHTI